jgi:hypothetical protein
VESRQEQLQKVITQIDRAGLRVPAAILLDLLAPLDVISSQIAQFAHPFMRGTSLDPYARLLTETANWEELRELLSHQ